MKRIVIFGAAPLPLSGDAVASGPSIRTWQFVRPIVDAGHRAVVYALRPGCDEGGVLSETEGPGGLRVFEVATNFLQNPEVTVERVASFKPDAILGVGTILPVWAGVRLSNLAPVWADVFGDPIVELQAKAQLYPAQGVEDVQYHVYRMLTDVLRRADRLSALSNPQAHAIMGMLALAGRLDARTAAAPLTHVIPCGLDTQAQAPHVASHRDRARAKLGYRPDDFVVAWSGSYNTWMDGDALFEGIERAMRGEPRIRYLSTGGGQADYNSAVYDRFRERVQASPLRDRFDLRGWLPRTEAEFLQAAADVGINIDRWTREAVLGSRSRILHMLNIGLPVASTCICELTRDLRDAGGLFEFAVGDPGSLAELLAGLAREPGERLGQSAAVGRDFVRKRYAFEETMRECLEWVEAPRRAPDRPGGEDPNPTPISRLGNDEALRAQVVVLSERPRGVREALVRALKRRLGRGA